MDNVLNLNQENSLDKSVLEYYSMLESTKPFLRNGKYPPVSFIKEIKAKWKSITLENPSLKDTLINPYRSVVTD